MQWISYQKKYDSMLTNYPQIEWELMYLFAVWDYSANGLCQQTAARALLSGFSPQLLLWIYVLWAINYLCSAPPHLCQAAFSLSPCSMGLADSHVSKECTRQPHTFDTTNLQSWVLSANVFIRRQELIMFPGSEQRWSKYCQSHLQLSLEILQKFFSSIHT